MSHGLSLSVRRKLPSLPFALSLILRWLWAIDRGDRARRCVSESRVIVSRNLRRIIVSSGPSTSTHSVIHSLSSSLSSLLRAGENQTMSARSACAACAPRFRSPPFPLHFPPFLHSTGHIPPHPPQTHKDVLRSRTKNPSKQAPHGIDPDFGRFGSGASTHQHSLAPT